jgi:hypothetical protein
MTKDLGVWTYENSALVLIDYQKEMFETVRSETTAELVDLNVRLLARTAKAFNMPVVLSTIGVNYGLNRPTHASILSELPGLEPIDRTSMNAFEDRAVSDAVKKTGRKRLIFGGLHTEISLTFGGGSGVEGRLRGNVRHRCGRRAITIRASHSHRADGARRRCAEHRARRRHGALPRLGVAVGR